MRLAAELASRPTQPPPCRYGPRLVCGLQWPSASQASLLLSMQTRTPGGARQLDQRPRRQPSRGTLGARGLSAGSESQASVCRCDHGRVLLGGRASAAKPRAGKIRAIAFPASRRQVSLELRARLTSMRLATLDPRHHSEERDARGSGAAGSTLVATTPRDAARL